MKSLTALALAAMTIGHLSGQSIALFHVDQPPEFIVNAGPDALYESGLVLGGAPTAQGGGENYSYLWSPPEFLDNPSSATPTVLSLGAQTTFTVVVTDLLTGCSKTDQTSVGVLQAIGSNAIGSTRLYPNPSSELIWIESAEELDYVQVRAISGQEVMAQAANGSRGMSMDLTSLSGGFFLVDLTFSSGRNQTIKLCHVHSSR